ncbi:MAG: Crp/Fnr family transcriptional regulator [Ruminiclostridium sp.]|nr:Crp/Fnr family transcriptional regulator [Ruminiclostridium sp.]
MDRLQDRLVVLPFWNDLNETQCQTLLRGTMEQTLPVGSLLEEENGMLLLLKGSIRVYLLSEEGREVTLFHLRSGDVCTLGAARVPDRLPFVPQMIVEEDCQVLVTRASALQSLREESLSVRAFVYEQGSRHLVQMVWAMEQIIFLHVDRRLASFLLEEYSRTGNREIRMTHEEIARQISSAREVVARMVKRFSAQGLVEARRGVLYLTDLEGFQKLMQ